MNRSRFEHNVVKKRKYTKPCKTLENIRWEYIEDTQDPESQSAGGNNVGEFWFGISFPLETFKEIRQVR
jgi:hypothetical protein